jgi:YHS domain-containing protein
MKENFVFKLFKLATYIGVLFLFSSCMSIMSIPNQASKMHRSNTISRYSETNFDVVCGKTIEANLQSFSSQYNNKPYYFDSEDCLHKFQQSPNTYINKNIQNKKNNSLLYWGLGAASMGVLMFFMIH